MEHELLHQLSVLIAFGFIMVIALQLKLCSPLIIKFGLWALVLTMFIHLGLGILE